jgi:hypothetical protein
VRCIAAIQARVCAEIRQFPPPTGPPDDTAAARQAVRVETGIARVDGQPTIHWWRKYRPSGDEEAADALIEFPANAIEEQDNIPAS